MLEMTDDITINGIKLKKVNKRYSAITLLYVLLCGGYSLCILGAAILSATASLTILLDCLIMKAGTVTCGIISCYKKRNDFAIYASLIQILAAICFGGINVILLLVTAFLGIMTLLNNKKYLYLSEQVGFPHFNERRVMEEIDKRQRDIKDEFQQSYERFSQNSSRDMYDVDLNSRDPFMMGKENEKEEETGSMDSIEF